MVHWNISVMKVSYILVRMRWRTRHRRVQGQCPILHLARFTEPLPDKNYCPLVWNYKYMYVKWLCRAKTIMCRLVSYWPLPCPRARVLNRQLTFRQCLSDIMTGCFFLDHPPKGWSWKTKDNLVIHVMPTILPFLTCLGAVQNNHHLPLW